MKRAKILVVDNESDIRDFLSSNLTEEGYEVYTASDGTEAVQMTKKIIPDVILLEVITPEMDGIEACKEIRGLPEGKNTLIVFLTTQKEDYSQIAGLDAGADDYVFKPIKPRVLVSRIKALLRRRTDPLEIGIDGRIKINKENYSIAIDKKDILLTKKQFKLIYLLASDPGKVFTREDILNEVWGSDVVVGDRTIDVHIRKLRKLMGNEMIKTRRGVGYEVTP